jgi:LPXTG-motif cell wall-anchored protein
VRVGLTDPGGRGDLALASISTGDADGGAARGDGDGSKPTRLPATGQDSSLPVLVGLLLLAAGLALRRQRGFGLRSG